MPRSDDWTSMRVTRVVLIACLVSVGLWAEEVSGTWRAEVQGRHGDTMEITMDLKDDDGVLTGTVRGPSGQEAISSGSVDGDAISFYVVTDLDGRQLRQHYRGTLESDVIHFTRSVEDGRFSAAPARDFDAKRVS